MAKNKVVWSSEAIDALDHILEYVFEEWGINPVLDLQNEIERVIIAIGNNKRLCPDSKRIGLRKCILSKQTSLIYKITKSQLEIVTFIDNRSVHKY
jgi:plasmid stabilization system protein ParE